MSSDARVLVLLQAKSIWRKVRGRGGRRRRRRRKGEEDKDEKKKKEKDEKRRRRRLRQLTNCL